MVATLAEQALKENYPLTAMPVILYENEWVV
jgi:hypothetical protein